ncbi:MAG: Na+/H+ antiporter subunit B [Vicinamibacterales bacterium]
MSPFALATVPAALAAACAVEFASALGTGGRLISVPWAPSLGLTFAFNLDPLGLLFALLITGVGTLVFLYAAEYLRGHDQTGRFFASLLAFMGAMLGLVLSDNILTLFVFWELTGFTSFLLIGFDHERAESRAAAIQALIVTGGGGLALLAAGVLMADATGTTSLSAIAASGVALADHALYPAIATLVLLAAFTKSAQAPFSFWLPNAMAAPTPVSAYLHSATMVKAGLYLIARMTPLLGATALWTTAITVAGAATMVIGAWRAVQEVDLKRILAYSTVSALGVITMLLGVGTQATVTAALVYLVAHACYKGALFLVAGAVDHETGTRDITALSGLRRAMPATSLAGGVAALSMIGVPLTLGFVGKETAYEALLHGGTWGTALLVLLIGSSILLGLAALLAGVVPFRGEPSHEELHEPGWALRVPPMILAALGLLAGIVPFLLDTPIAAAAAAVVAPPVAVELAVWHGLTPALGLSVLTLAGVGVAFLVGRPFTGRLWQPAWGAEALYTRTIAALDAASRVIGPPLHSASLRSYVMAILFTTIAAGGTALMTIPRFSASITAISARPHEALVAVMIVAAAIAATLSRSTMGAVLSLGAVGYGVATTFLMFGAPDLAMTQFSVETLTVLIYVMVFRHFRGLGALSPTLVRTRDALIAIGGGTFITALVLAVATTETPPGLREFFAEAAPVLGHGRNIVNVILVDFRAFDTLGEITVLTTAAIGVRALLRLAEDDPEARAQREAAMTSPIFLTATRLLMPLMLLFALFLLLRGHNEPGGGFVGGLVAAAAFALHALGYGVASARRTLRVTPHTLLGVGLLVALASGLPATLVGQPYLTAQWALDPIAIGTPVLFDLGVFLVVTGVVLMMVFTLAEEEA